MIQDIWAGCYDLNWKNLITPAAFSHPAKFSHGLIKRIYDHALAEGMIQPGGVVLDPFGGVGLGALYAMQNGLHWVGVELESKFVELGRENINLWNDRYAAHFPNWGSAQLLQGDSRRLSEVVSAAGLVVSSPPYATDALGHSRGAAQQGRDKDCPSTSYGSTPGQLATLPPGTPPSSLILHPSALISSPPFAGNSGGRGEASRQGIDAALFDRHSGGMIGGMGDEPGNLGNLPMGQAPVAIVSSPPYASARPESNGGGVDLTKQWETYRASGGGQSLEAFTATQLKHSEGYAPAPGQLGAMVVGSPPFADSVGSDDPDKRGGLFRDEKRRNDTNLTGTYGTTEGQLGGMKAGVAVVGSPPFENVEGFRDKSFSDQWGPKQLRTAEPSDYGSTAGQIGATQGDTFWASAKTIIDQCYQILPPNAYAIWVLKAYVKGGKIVDFPEQWRHLCEACGFETVHVHQAMLVKHQGVQQGAMEGESVSKEVSHKSFFRRLSERRGAPKIDFETVLCMVKPA